MKPYLLVFNTTLVGRDEMLIFLDSRPEILHWLSVFPGAVFVISEHDANALTRIVHQRFPQTLLVVTEVSPSTPGKTDGWLFPQNWNFINEPKSSGRWK